MPWWNSLAYGAAIATPAAFPSKAACCSRSGISAALPYARPALSPCDIIKLVQHAERRRTPTRQALSPARTKRPRPIAGTPRLANSAPPTAGFTRINPAPNGGTARGYEGNVVPLTALASHGYGPMDGQPAVYLYIAALEVNVLNCRVEGISASSTRVALACGFILAVTRTGVLNPGRARAVVPPGEMLQVQQLPPAVIRSPADSPAARRVVCMAAVSSSRVASCSRGRRGHEGARDGPRQLLPGTGRDDPARRRRLPVQSQQYGASLACAAVY